ncbi:MAG: carboxypeptidase-like regulatory domain-containing protein, partial [Chloroflexi bacterium]|nr:carboxypeptidase-like regulatory domain-containing protein [Chloroflexota bacterium]
MLTRLLLGAFISLFMLSWHNTALADGATVRGFVRYNTTPLAGITVSLRSLQPADPNITTTSDDNGNFIFTNVPMGNYGVRVEDDQQGYLGTALPLSVGASYNSDFIYKLYLRKPIHIVTPAPGSMIPQINTVSFQLPPSPDEVTHYGIFLVGQGIFLFYISSENPVVLPTPLCAGSYRWSVISITASNIPVAESVSETPLSPNDIPRSNPFTVQVTDDPLAPTLTNGGDCGIHSGPPGAVQLSWTLPLESIQYQLQVIPFASDGPALNLIRTAENSFMIPPPVLGQGNYFLLPSMLYAWRVRATNSTQSIGENESGWSPWSRWSLFNSGVPQSMMGRPGHPLTPTITVVSPPANGVATSLTPTMQWADTDTAIWYYEVQISTD